MRRTRNAAWIAAALLAAAALVPGSSSANGDPASDVLFTEDVFLPYPAPPKSASSALRQSVAGAYAHGFRLKVAVIATPADLGAVPSMFGRPVEYARFLGLELTSVYVGPLLIVMPAGYGIYDGGRTTAAEQEVLAKLHVSGAAPDELAASATKAVQQLVAARALRSKDIKAPYLYPSPLRIVRGRPAKLLYRVIDDSHRSRETARVLDANEKTVLVVRTKFHPAYWNRPRSLTVSLAARRARPGLRYCMVSQDPSGNTTTQFCDKITVVGG